MFCKYCGNQLPDNVNFCPQCGKIVDGENENTSSDDVVVVAQQSAAQTNYFYAPVSEDTGSSVSAMVFGILSLILSLTFYFSIVGFIFAIIARVKVNNFVNRYRGTNGMIKAGSITSKLGLVFSIIMLVIITVAFILGFQ